MSPEVEKDTLEHFGVKGMKWGVHKQKQLDRTNLVASGKASALQSIRFKATVTIPELISNKGDVKRIAKGRATILQKQKDRINSGNATKRDKLDRVLNTPITDLFRGR